jgi:serpin B
MFKKEFAPIIIILIIAILAVGGVSSYKYFTHKPQTGGTNEGVSTITIFRGDNVVEANNQFSLDLYNKYSAAKKEDENIFFSPFSISSAIAMVYEGAKGKTAEEIQSVFHFPAEVKVLREGYQNIYNNINNNNNESKTDLSIFQVEGYKLNTANALWIQNNYQLLDDYLTTLQQYYAGNAANVDFKNSTEEARRTINKWVESKTNNRIKNLFPQGSLDNMTRFVLTNTIYFKGQWVSMFAKSSTEEKDFKITSLLKTKAQMMNQTSHYKYAKLRDLQLLQLSYIGYSDESLSMLVILPKDNDISSIEKNFNMQILSEWVSELEVHKVNVSLPKFKIETTENVGNDLKVMGMPAAFSETANFSGITGTQGLYIDKVLHKTFIENKEEGTEATAATGMNMPTIGVSPPREKTYIFNADHAFIFLIQQQTRENRDRNELGNILFIGRVSNPSEN